MSAYIVFTRTKTLDQKELETYWAGIKATVKGHPIEVLVAYGKYEVLEGGPIEGIEMPKFTGVKAAKDWYYSEAYQSVAQPRKRGAIYDGLIVEGVSQSNMPKVLSLGPRRRSVKKIVVIGTGRIGGAFATAFAKRTSHAVSIRGSH